MSVSELLRLMKRGPLKALALWAASICIFSLPTQEAKCGPKRWTVHTVPLTLPTSIMSPYILNFLSQAGGDKMCREKWNSPNFHSSTHGDCNHGHWWTKPVIPGDVLLADEYEQIWLGLGWLCCVNGPCRNFSPGLNYMRKFQQAHLSKLACR